MGILNYIALLAIFFLMPAVVLWLCRRVSLLGKVGPIMVLYAIGMLIGNLPIIPRQIASLQELLPNILIPLAIPMMLYGCTFSRSEARLQLKIVSSGFLSVAVAVAVGYLLFGRNIEQGDAVGGIVTGMYTGGTLNAAALQTIFSINGESYVLINSYDIIISFLYFVFLFSVGIKALRRAYGEPAIRPIEPTDDAAQTPSSQTDRSAHADPSSEQSFRQEGTYRRIFTREGARQMAKILGLTLLIVALSAGVALLLPEQWFMVVFILMITTLGVAASFNRQVRRLDVSYDVGMYLIYIFSITIASMADFSNLDLRGGVYLLGFMLVAVFLSLLLHAVMCRVMKVDADSMIISSVAFINSPPFVPMASVAMQNKRALVTGLGAGIVGYAAGNHLGVLMATLLSLI